MAPTATGLPVKVLAMTRYGREGASSRVRFLQFLPALAGAGVDVTVKPLWDSRHLQRFYRHGSRSTLLALERYALRTLELLREARQHDVVWLEGELFPYLPALAERLLSLPYVVDYDDAVFHKYDTSRALRPILGRKIDAIMRHAAAVVVGSPYVAARARAAGARSIELIPTVVDLARYPLLPPPAGVELRVGWIGTPHTARYLDALAGPLARACRDLPIRLVVVGAQVTLPGVMVECHPWSEDSEASLIAGFDVGVMPLPDEPWERGKSGYKLIQCMAAGRPVIASPVGVNLEIVEGVGRLASTEEEWAAAVVELGRSRQLRERLGAAGRARVAERFSLDVVAPRLVEVLRSAQARGASKSRSA